MGASSWSYYIPYNPDISEALQQLKERVFENGEYYAIFTKTEKLQFLASELLRLESIDPKTDMEESIFEEYQDQYRLLKSLPEPTNFEEGIKELFAINQEDGTHSILDIDGISSEPEYFMAAPLTQSELLALFGTDKPTQEMIESQKDVLMTLRSSWKATYVIVYKNGEPESIYFTGFSGD